MDDWQVRRCATLSEAEMEGEVLGLNVEQGTCYGFNTTASAVWKMLCEPRYLRDIRAALLEQYDVDPETCDRELRALLRDLERDGLVSIESGAA